MSQAGQNTQSSNRPQRRTLWLAVSLVGVVLLVVLLAFGLRPRSSAVFQGKPAPDFELTAFNSDYVGQNFTLEGLRGQVVVLNMWASWCVECEAEMTLFEEAWQAYRDQGVVFLGVDYLDTDSAGLAYLDRFGTTYPNGPDTGSRIFQDYRCTGVPETFFIDRDGIVQHVQIGPISEDRLYALLDGLVVEGGQ
jgi:cytochrome c biogenesis protein CcmG/thiol:disulfide interchange protein DsbE